MGPSLPLVPGGGGVEPSVREQARLRKMQRERGRERERGGERERERKSERVLRHSRGGGEYRSL